MLLSISTTGLKGATVVDLGLGWIVEDCGQTGCPLPQGPDGRHKTDVGLGVLGEQVRKVTSMAASTFGSGNRRRLHDANDLQTWAIEPECMDPGWIPGPFDPVCTPKRATAPAQ